MTGGIRYHDHGLKWRVLKLNSNFAMDLARAQRVERRLMKIMLEWEGTPYMSGQQMKGVGVDCVRFVCGVLDECYGTKTLTPRDVQDVALHNRKGAIRTMRAMRKLFPNHQKVTDLVVEPGDVIITGERSGGPGHAIIVGAEENTLWQAMYHGVQRCGLGLIQDYQRVFRIYRFKDKHTWVD